MSRLICSAELQDLAMAAAATSGCLPSTLYLLIVILCVGMLQLPEMTTKRGSSAAATLGEDLVVVGGFDGSTFHDSVEAYDTRAGKWRMLAPMAEPRAYAAAACVDGKLYAMGGMCGAVSRFTLLKFVHFPPLVTIYRVNLPPS